jgi:hypothetical protein
MKFIMTVLWQPERIGDPILGIIIPGVILLLSMVSTWLLFKRFSRKEAKEGKSKDH